MLPFLLQRVDKDVPIYNLCVQNYRFLNYYHIIVPVLLFLFTVLFFISKFVQYCVYYEWDTLYVFFHF